MSKNPIAYHKFGKIKLLGSTTIRNVLEFDHGITATVLERKLSHFAISQDNKYCVFSVWNRVQIYKPSPSDNQGQEDSELVNMEDNGEQTKTQYNIEIFIYQNLDGSLKFIKTIEVFNVQNFQARYFKAKFKNDITCPIEISKNSKVLVYATSVLS